MLWSLPNLITVICCTQAALEDDMEITVGSECSRASIGGCFLSPLRDSLITGVVLAVYDFLGPILKILVLTYKTRYNLGLWYLVNTVSHYLFMQGQCGGMP